MVSTKDIYIKIGECVKQIRKEKGITQEKLAFGANLNRAYVGYIERGERKFSIETIYRISKALKVPLCEFFCFRKETCKQ